MTYPNFAIASVALILSAGAVSAEVIRHPLPDSDFPILQAVEVPADATLVYLSGTVPEVIDENAADGSAEQFGNTAAQTTSTLASIDKKLSDLDLTMGDVIKMQAYLVVPEGSETMDFDGFMEGYTKYFGTEDQPNLPTHGLCSLSSALPTLHGWSRLRSSRYDHDPLSWGAPLFIFHGHGHDRSRRR